MSYDLSTPERFVERLSKSIPFGLEPHGWDDILTLARQELDKPEFNPTRIWVVLDEEDSEKMGLALQEKNGNSVTTHVIDIKQPDLTEDQTILLKLLYSMTTPAFSRD
jgi:hypothetical protein